MIRRTKRAVLLVVSAYLAMVTVLALWSWFRTAY